MRSRGIGPHPHYVPGRTLGLADDMDKKHNGNLAKSTACSAPPDSMRQGTERIGESRPRSSFCPQADFSQRSKPSHPASLPQVPPQQPPTTTPRSASTPCTSTCWPFKPDPPRLCPFPVPLRSTTPSPLHHALCVSSPSPRRLACDEGRMSYSDEESEARIMLHRLGKRKTVKQSLH